MVRFAGIAKSKALKSLAAGLGVLVVFALLAVLALQLYSQVKLLL